MTIKYVVAHRKDPNNVGDIASNPLQYFLKPDEYETIDIALLGKESYNTSVPVIVGGGGLLNNNNFGENVKTILNSPDRNQLERMFDEGWNLSNPQYADIYKNFNNKYRTLIQETLKSIPSEEHNKKILWGAGVNADVEGLIDSPPKFPKWLIDYDLVGVRDYHQTSKFRWAPCASCMHPALRKEYTIKNDIIFFEHKKQLIKGIEFSNDPIPRFVNSGSNIDQTIELLGSANIILTNSYHGVYWGTLLKKRVIVVGSWSSKFSYLKHQPAIIGKKMSWDEVIDTANIYHTAIDECITETNAFWEDVKRL
jgi:hypothetical protein